MRVGENILLVLNCNRKFWFGFIPFPLALSIVAIGVQSNLLATCDILYNFAFDVLINKITFVLLDKTETVMKFIAKIVDFKCFITGIRYVVITWLLAYPFTDFMTLVLVIIKRFVSLIVCKVENLRPFICDCKMLSM